VGTYIDLPNRPNFYPNNFLNCKSNNIVYCLICNKCSKIYIGQTTLPFCKRITLHRQHSNNLEYTILFCNKHFNSCALGFKAIPLFQLKDFTLSKLNFIEHFFITFLKPELNCSL